MFLHSQPSTRLLVVLALLATAPVVFGQRLTDGDPVPRGVDRLVITEIRNGSDRLWQVTGPFGGDVTVLVVDPRNADHLLAGTSDGLVYQSLNGGQRWRSLRPGTGPGLGMAGHAVTGILFDRTDTARIYVSLKSINALNEGDRGGGLFISGDRGATWRAVDGLKEYPIRGIAQSASHPEVLAVAALDGVYRTRDLGATWEKISHPTNAAMRGYHSIAIDPRAPDTIYVGTSHLPWKTTDDGRTWRLAGSAQTGMLDDSDIFSIQIDEDNPDTLLLSACSGIYRSFDASATWTRFKGIPTESRRTQIIRRHPTRPGTIFAGTTEGLWVSHFYGMADSWRRVTSEHLLVNSVAIHPSRPDRIYLGTEDSGVLISTDGGESWRTANDGLINRQVGAVHADLEERGRIYAGILFDGESSGIYVSADGGLSWKHSVNGLIHRDIYSLYQSPFETGSIYAGTNQGIYRSDDRGRSWRQLRRTPPPPVGPELARPKIVGSKRPRSSSQSSSQRSRRQTPPSRGPSRKNSLPGGATTPPAGPERVDLLSQVFAIQSLTPRHDLLTPPPASARPWLITSTWDGVYLTDDESRGWWRLSILGSNWRRDPQVASIATTHQAPGLILVGTRDGLYISNDNGRTFRHQVLGEHHLAVRAITFDPRTARTIYAGTTGGFFRSFDGGETWEQRGGGMPVHTSAGTIRINELNPDELFLSDDLRNSLYFSKDRGTNWERLEVGLLPSTLFRSITGDPFDAHRLYLGTVSGGVYVLSRPAE